MGTFHQLALMLATNVSRTIQTHWQMTPRRMTDDTAKHDSFRTCSNSTYAWLPSALRCRSWSHDPSQPTLRLSLAFHCPVSSWHVVSSRPLKTWSWKLEAENLKTDSNFPFGLGFLLATFCPVFGTLFGHKKSPFLTPFAQPNQITKNWDDFSEKTRRK